MKVTITYDNTAYKRGLKSDWGFSALVETENKNILFDAGASSKILLYNMDKLNIKPSIVDMVFISHNHFDHTGGLSGFLDRNPDVDVYVPANFRGIKNAQNTIYIKEAKEIADNIYTTGILKNIEQSMMVKTEKGLVVIVGCSHPGVENILNAASEYGDLYALIGGLHGFKEFECIADLTLVCPTHCTKYKGDIKELYKGKYVEGGVGQVIEI